jgi:DNA sulfur modification protein DndE
MSLSRIYVGQQVDSRLRNLKARTGLTPNLVCRLGFCLSLAEPGVPDLELYADGQAREFNRYTLTGQWDAFFFALLRERLLQDRLEAEEHLEEQFKAHLCRGVMLFSQRVKTLGDLARLVREAGLRSHAENTTPDPGHERSASHSTLGVKEPQANQQTRTAKPTESSRVGPAETAPSNRPVVT